MMMVLEKEARTCPYSFSKSVLERVPQVLAGFIP